MLKALDLLCNGHYSLGRGSLTLIRFAASHTLLGIPRAGSRMLVLRVFDPGSFADPSLDHHLVAVMGARS